MSKNAEKVLKYCFSRQRNWASMPFSFVKTKRWLGRKKINKTDVLIRLIRKGQMEKAEIFFMATETYQYN